MFNLGDISVTRKYVNSFDYCSRIYSSSLSFNFRLCQEHACTTVLVIGCSLS